MYYMSQGWGAYTLLGSNRQCILSMYIQALQDNDVLGCTVFLPAGRVQSVWPAGPKITLRVRDGYREAAAKSGNARSEQLLVVPTELLTNRQRLLGGPSKARLVFRYEISDLFLW